MGALSAATEVNKMYLLGSSCYLHPAAAFLPTAKLSLWQSYATLRHTK